jgi:hypothetical protein
LIEIHAANLARPSSLAADFPLRLAGFERLALWRTTRVTFAVDSSLRQRVTDLDAVALRSPPW